MRWNFTEPGDARVAEGSTRVEAAGDSTGDEHSPLLRHQPQYTLLRRHQLIQPHRLSVQVVHDGVLQSVVGKRDPHLTELISSEVRNCRSIAEHVEPSLCCGMPKEIEQEF